MALLMPIKFNSSKIEKVTIYVMLSIQAKPKKNWVLKLKEVLKINYKIPLSGI